jgi:Fe-S cluster assembly scaffold protein SufB
MLRNTLKRAEKAKKKKAALGEDIDFENFEREEAGEHEEIESLKDLSNKNKKSLLKVGVDASEAGRAGSFLQIDQSKVCSNCKSEAIELMGLPQAIEKYDWVKDYMWNAVPVDTDKYTAKTALGEPGGYFIRSLPNTKEVFPIQACMFIGDEKVAQTAII